jgi:hypothetical protein
MYTQPQMSGSRITGQGCTGWQLVSKAEGAAGGRKSIRVSSSSSSSAAPARVHLVVAAQPDERAGALWRGLARQPLRLGPLQHLPHHLHVLVRARLDVVVELHQDAVAAVCMHTHTQASTYDQLQLAVFFRKGKKEKVCYVTYLFIRKKIYVIPCTQLELCCTPLFRVSVTGERKDAMLLAVAGRQAGSACVPATA